jgi:5-methylcytosine-specific restriction protein A
MSRAVEEWVGATPDTTAPPRVRLRVFEAHKGICHISGRKIGPADQWDLDHVIALCNGGQNRESNLAPALRDKHREKTSNDTDEKSRIASLRQRHLGIKPKKPKSKWKRKVDGTTVLR